MNKAIGYIRVSTEGQALDGVSLDVQRAKIAAWADLNARGFNARNGREFQATQIQRMVA